MPISITFTLDPRGQPLPANAIPALHATFFQWLERGDAATAKHVHAISDPKPYTVSALTLGNETGAAAFRITLLDDTLWEPVQRGMEAKPEARIFWATLPFAEPPLVEQRSYAQIGQEASNTPIVILQFESPTSFRSHEMHYPLPDPVLVFASHRARWNAFAPESLQIDERWLEWLQQSVAVSRFVLNTESLKFKEYTLIGFTGTVQYSVVAGAPDREGRGPLNALADYAYFCGTGHKTTQGMGQTRRLSKWPDA